MATLKICAEGTQWLTNVSRVVLIGHFDIPAGEFEDMSEKAAHDRVWAAATRAKLVDDRCSVHTVDFENSESGIAIDVYFSGVEASQFWLVPYRSCFLMGDDGKTIDRI